MKISKTQKKFKSITTLTAILTLIGSVLLIGGLAYLIMDQDDSNDDNDFGEQLEYVSSISNSGSVVKLELVANGIYCTIDEVFVLDGEILFQGEQVWWNNESEPLSDEGTLSCYLKAGDNITLYISIEGGYSNAKTYTFDIRYNDGESVRYCSVDVTVYLPD